MAEELCIVDLRRERKLGIKRLRNELIRLHGLRLSVDTVHKVLYRHGLNRLTRPRLIRKGTRRYSRPLPGDRVQMDVCKIGPQLYQYTAIDDCSRYQVIGLFPSRSAKSTLAFLDQLVEEMPVSIQRIQTDRGQEFFAYKVQGQVAVLEHQVPAYPAPLAPSRRQGRAGAENSTGGVLADCRSEGSGTGRQAGRMAALLQLGKAA